MEAANMAGIMMPIKDVLDWVLENSKILRVYPLTTKTDFTRKHHRLFNEIIVISLFLFCFFTCTYAGFTGHWQQVTQATSFIPCNIILVGTQFGTFLALAD